ncbi:argonaute/piwi family protein [Falsiroseomonas sp. CW058]|uniref:argonaute/piwi family protein n=1 Tax=Falsiroseomonas sp. CW058 TaxID=3388664 RepID=UPI003D3221B0
MTSLPTILLPEPELSFGHGQTADNPKDGLFLFGPVIDETHPRQLRLGVIGTSEGLGRYDRWAARMRGYIPVPDGARAHHMPWPGFEAAFACEWPERPMARIALRLDDLVDAIQIKSRQEAVYKAVGLYLNPILAHLRREEARPTLWFVLLPEDIYRYGRQESVVPRDRQRPGDTRAGSRLVRSSIARGQGLLFAEDNAAAELHKFSADFHNQLKARLLKERVAVQLLRETTIAPDDFLSNTGRPVRRLQDEATRAWNLGVATFFKAEGKPWGLAAARPGVAYVGLVFKHVPDGPETHACCGAQMFLASGAGTVFRGAMGPWRSKDRREFHLSRAAAADLIGVVVEEFRAKHDGEAPKELFVHGKIGFSDEEWEGFASAVPAETNLVGVRIRQVSDLKVFTPGKMPLLRGHALLLAPRKAFLWTNGFVPRLNTYPGWEVPRPLAVDLVRGDADMEAVLGDVLALTKLNYNSADYAVGLPVTLGFADDVGTILTAAPTDDTPPLPFRYYM